MGSVQGAKNISKIFGRLAVVDTKPDAADKTAPEDLAAAQLTKDIHGAVIKNGLGMRLVYGLATMAVPALFYATNPAQISVGAPILAAVFGIAVRNTTEVLSTITRMNRILSGEYAVLRYTPLHPNTPKPAV